MTYTPLASFNQVETVKRLNKKSNLDSLPVIDPPLISISLCASRFIVEIETAFTSIVNAPSNDGCEVTLTQWFRCARNSPETFDGERVEIDGAFNILVMDTYAMLQQLIREWWLKRFRIFLFGPDFYFNSKEKIEHNAPIEIKGALRAFALTDERRETLRDILALSQKFSLGLARAD